MNRHGPSSSRLTRIRNKASYPWFLATGVANFWPIPTQNFLLRTSDLFPLHLSLHTLITEPRRLVSPIPSPQPAQSSARIKIRDSVVSLFYLASLPSYISAPSFIPSCPSGRSGCHRRCRRPLSGCVLTAMRVIVAILRGALCWEASNVRHNKSLSNVMAGQGR